MSNIYQAEATSIGGRTGLAASSDGHLRVKLDAPAILGGSGGDGQSQRGIVRGTIASLSGSTWTIDNQRGTTITVRITSSTAFGTPGSSERAADFATGDEVIVVGTRSGDTVTATRILKLSDFPLRPPSTPGPSTPGS